MLPVSITMFVTSAIGSRLSTRFPVRTIVRAGLVVTLAGTLILLATIQPTLSTPGSPSAWPCSVGYGLDVVPTGQCRPSVGRGVWTQRGGRAPVHWSAARYVAGPRPYRGNRALGLASTFISNVEKDPRMSSEVAAR